MTATLGSRRFPEQDECVHCAAPVRTTNYVFGQRLEHFDPDASFNDSVWQHCRLTTATLKEPCCDDGPSGHTEQEHHDATPCYEADCPLAHPNGGPFPHPCDKPTGDPT